MTFYNPKFQNTVEFCKILFEASENDYFVVYFTYSHKQIIVSIKSDRHCREDLSFDNLIF